MLPNSTGYDYANYIGLGLLAIIALTYYIKHRRARTSTESATDTDTDRSAPRRSTDDR